MNQEKSCKTISLDDFRAGDTQNNILPEYKDLLSVNDLSKLFGVSKQTIYKELRAGKFGTPIQIGRAYKFPKVIIVRKFFCFRKD